MVLKHPDGGIPPCIPTAEPHNLPYIEHSDIAKGGTLTFEMSDKPAKWY